MHQDVLASWHMLDFILSECFSDLQEKHLKISL